MCVYGGAPISGQERTLRRGVDVAVGTPGRIMDLMERGALDLQEVRYMVLDEADQVGQSSGTFFSRRTTCSRVRHHEASHRVVQLQ